MSTLQIHYTNVEATPELQEAIENEFAKLDRYSDRIVATRMVVEGPNSRGEAFYHVDMQVDVPGKTIIVTPRKNHDRTPELAVKHAVDTANRQIGEYFERRFPRRPRT